MRATVFVLSLLLYVMAATAAETKVYRWTDDQGVVHFSTSAPPSDTEGVEEQTVREAPNPGSVAPTLRSPEEDAALAEARQQASIEARGRAEQSELRRINCERARQRIAAIEPAQRVRIQKPDGSEEWLYGEDRIAELERNRKLVRENCD